MTTDLLWIVGGPPDGPGREELRYSIRSAVQHLRIDYRDVVVVGDVPAWFGGVRIPLRPQPGKWENQRASLSAYLNLPDAAEQVVVLNDDMYVTEPISEIVTIRNKARGSEWSADHPQHAMTCWTCAVKACAHWMMDDLGRDIWLYECHTPLLLDVAGLRDLINRYPRDLPFMLGEAYAHAGVGGEGVVAGNAKVKTADSLADKLALPMPYLSGNPDSWRGDLGDLIRGAFPKPCRYEKEA